MSFYRAPARRWPWVFGTAVVVAVIAFPLGVKFGEDSAPTLGEQVYDAYKSAGAAVNRLAVVETEYPQAVRNGKVVGKIEYVGTKDRATQAQQEIKGLRGSLGLIDPDAYNSALRNARLLSETIDERSSITEVRALVNEIKTELSY